MTAGSTSVAAVNAGTAQTGQQRKRHHAVPAHYLARFAGADGRLWQYMRGAADPQRVHPSNAAVGKHLYSLEAGGVPVDDSIEVWLADNVDGPAATLIPKLIARRTLRGGDRARFSLFLALQEVRIPRFRDLIDETLAGIGRQILQARAQHDPEGLRELFASKGIELSEEAFAAEMKQYRAGAVSIRPSKAWWLNSLKVANQSAPLIAARAWKVIEAPHPVEFVTSDAPVVRVLTRNVPETRRSLWGGRWLEGTFPLDPKHLLLIRSPDGPDGTRGWSDGAPRSTSVRCDRRIASCSRGTALAWYTRCGTKTPELWGLSEMRSTLWRATVRVAKAAAMPDLSRAAQAALPAFLELMRTASRDQLPADDLSARMTALGAEHRLQGPELGEAFLFAALIHARELGGDAAAYRTRDVMAGIANRLMRGKDDEGE